jgi:hypothetical protein
MLAAQWLDCRNPLTPEAREALMSLVFRGPVHFLTPEDSEYLCLAAAFHGESLPFIVARAMLALSATMDRLEVYTRSMCGYDYNMRTLAVILGAVEPGTVKWARYTDSK